MTPLATLRAAADGLSARERRLAALAGGVIAAVVALQAGLFVWRDTTALAARVAARERELVLVRGLVARLGTAPAPDAADEPPLLSRVEAVAVDTVGRERIVEMTPARQTLGTGVEEERLALRVQGAYLAEVVRLLHALETSGGSLAIARLELAKLPAAPSAFAATIEVARVRRAP